MVEVVYPQENGPDVEVDLRDPYRAALLAWLWPGAGHIYQRRYGKAMLFMICVLSTFFIGLGLGRGRVVYASFDRADFRWQYICQLGAGAVTFPAMIQAVKTRDGGDPFWGLCERYPEDTTEGRPFEPIPKEILADPQRRPSTTLKDGFMAPPAGPKYQDQMDVLGMWHYEMKHLFEIGTLYCVIAGLLNLLAVYDAFTGPAILTPEQREQLEARRKRKRRREPTD